MSFLLSSEEVVELTGRKHASRQIEALRGMGVEFRQRPDGSLAILRSHINTILGNEEMPIKQQSITPNWQAINGPCAQ